MADNTILNVGAGGDTYRSEDLGAGVKIAVSKIYLGAHGIDGGAISAGNPLPVTVGNFPGTQAVSIAALPPLTAGSAIIGAVTQSGTWTITTGGATFGVAFPATGTAIGAKDSTGTNLVALNVDAAGFLKVNVAAGGASGGTSSTVGAAYPGTATAIGFKDSTGTNLVAGNLDASGNVKVLATQGAAGALAVAWPTKITDGTNLVSVFQTHNADNQSLGTTAYALNTGGVAQLLNLAGAVDRQRETGADNISSTGVATGTQQLKSPISTTLAALVTAGGTACTLTATKFTNNGAAAWIQSGSIITLEPGTTNQEQVRVSSVNYGTNVCQVTSLNLTGTNIGFAFSHANTSAISAGSYNEARDATSPEGGSGSGIVLGATTIWNAALNGGAGGWENERSALGENDGASGKGTAVAAEYEYVAGGPVLASGLATGFAYDRARSLNAKGVGTGTITTSVAGNAIAVFSSAAATNLIQPGQAIQLSGSGTLETVLATAAWVPGSSTTVPLQSPVVNSGQTTAKWDQYATGGPGLTGFLPYGVGIEEEALYNPVDGLYYVERSATTDAMAAANVVAENGVLWNGTTFDRERSAVSDAMATTGIGADAAMLWNGTSFDRERNAAGDNFGTALGAARTPGDKGVESEIAYLYGSNGTSFDPLQVDASKNLKVAVAAGTNLIGQASVSQQLGTIFNGTTPVAIQNAVINFNSITDQAIVAAVGGKTIYVLGITLIPAAATTMTVKNGVAGTALTGPMSLLASQPFSKADSAYPHFTSAVGGAFVLAAGSAVQVSGFAKYVQF